jgi:hypothetical protein
MSLLLPLLLALPLDDRSTSWQADLAFFAENFKSKHVRPFAKITEAEFDQGVKELKDNVGKLTNHQIVIGLWQLLGRVGDGHSTYTAPPSIPFRQYPLAVTWLKDGWYVFAVDDSAKQVLGGKLLALGKTPIDQAVAKLRGIGASENISAERNALQRHLVNVEVLHVLGLQADQNRGEFTIQKRDGQEEQITLTPVPRGQRPKVTMGVHPENWPTHLKQRRPQHGYAWLADNTVLYVWYDRCADNPALPIRDWIKQVLDECKKSPAKVIVDLRRNGGGNSILLLPLIAGLKADSHVNADGKLFILIGPGTYSSAMINAHEFRKHTKATLVGQPTGGSPNSPGEVKTFTLPHSKSVVQYSTKLFRLTTDGANTVQPDLLVEPTTAGFFADRDEILDTVLKK